MVHASLAVLFSLLTDHVAVDTLPPKDGWDKFAIWLTFALVIIGAVTFGVVLYQAIQTKKATIAAKEAAEAARLNAEAFVNSERAWIMVDLQPTAGDGPHIRRLEHSSGGTRTTGVQLSVVCRNEGRLPAWIAEKRVCAKFVESIPTEPDLESIDKRDPALEPVGVGKPSQPWDSMLICEGSYGSGETVRVLIIYGVVKYRDAFSKKHYTTFGYTLSFDNKLKRITESPKYNENV